MTVTVAVAPAQTLWKTGHTVALLVSLGALLLVATDPFNLPRPTTWFGVAAMLVLFLIATGHGLTGRADGVLIDARNRMSLSRLQLSAWTVLVVSAMITT